ncbi:MAG: tetratricopeptide repeat protein [Rhizobiaceae bacterium]|nr:tetratricopeptide repeat protein [Rhizobiaceae bacterium]
MGDPVEELKRVIRDREAIVVCGAGTTIGATGGKAPGWLDLIKRALDVAKAHNKVDDTEDWVIACNAYLNPTRPQSWLKAADEIVSQLGGVTGTGWRDFLRREVGGIDASFTDVPRAIDALGVPVATTNYDSILCKVLACDPATWRHPQHIADVLSGRIRGVWHLHGHWTDSESVIFSGHDYARVGTDEFAQFLQKHVAFGKTLIFVGCSTDGLGDRNVGEMLRWFGSNWLTSGRRHFVLVPDGKQTDTWPAGIEPVVHGSGHGSLPAFLRSLAPPAASTFGRLPPDPRMIGRKTKLAELVRLLLAGTTPIVIPGGPGMGKSTMALAAAHHPDISARWPERLFVPLDAVTEPRGILTETARALGADATGAESAVETSIAARVSTAPVLLILDNAETPLNAGERADREAALGTYKGLAAMPGLTLVVTCRDRPIVLNRGRQFRDIERLDDDSAKTLFLREAGGAHLADDPDLPALLAELDGHPLSIAIVGRGASGYDTVAPVLEDWRARKARLFGNAKDFERLDSTRISLGFSLASPNCTEAARRLVSVLGFLPGGLAVADLDSVLPDCGRDAERALVNLRLADRKGDRVTMLVPLRECARLDCPPSNEDRDRLFDLLLDLAAHGDHAGTGKWQEVGDRVLAEAQNFDAIAQAALAAGRSPATMTSALRGMAELDRFLGVGGVSAVSAAAEAAAGQGDSATAASCIRSLGDIALARSDHDRARARYDEAQPLFREVGEVLGEAHCIFGLGTIALVRSDHDGARARFEEALTLYRKVGDVLGEANCIRGLGNIALARSDHDGAGARYAEALPLYREVGDVLGEASCIRGLGNIALERSDYDGARARFEEALPLYRKVGSVLGEANSIQDFGDLARERFDPDGARAQFEQALALYGRIPEPYSIGGTHLRLMRIARDDVERERHRIAARAAWSSIKRDDLIAEYLE